MIKKYSNWTNCTGMNLNLIWFKFHNLINNLAYLNHISWSKTIIIIEVLSKIFNVSFNNTDIIRVHRLHINKNKSQSPNIVVQFCDFSVKQNFITAVKSRAKNGNQLYANE